MAEENQNMQAQPTSSLRAETDAFNRFKENAKKRISDDRWLRRSKDMETLYEKSLTTTDGNICWQYDRACKAEEMARGARKYWESKWYDWSNIDAIPLLNQYSALFPESTNTIYSYIVGKDQDPMPYYIKLWWEKSEEEINQNTSVYDLLYGKNEYEPDPIRRWVSAVLGWIGWIWVGTWDALKRVYNNFWDIYDIATDDDKSFIDKFNQILLWEIVLDDIGWSIWDIIWWWLEWWFKWFTSQKERNNLSDSVAWFVRTALESETWQDAVNRWNSLSEDEQNEAKDYLTYLDWVLNLIWVKWAKAIKPTVEKWTVKALNVAKEWLWPIVWWVDNVIDTTKKVVNGKQIKNAVKNEAKNTELVEWLANRIWQWETKDIEGSVKALQSISKWVDTKKVKTFKDLREAWRTREKQLVDKINENLSNKDFKIKLSDQKPIIIAWEEKWNVIDDAINDLIDVYSQQRKWDEVDRIQNLKNELEEWVDPKTFNDFIKEYWTELNAWNKKNELTTNTKKWWEETRNWMKELLRERMPESEFKALDREMSDVINFNRLVDSTVEKVNNITKRLRKEWVWNKTMWRIVEWWIDLLDMLTGKWVSKAVAKRVLWTKSAANLVDFAELEKELPKLLKSFDNINQELNKSKWFLETNEALNNAVNELDALVKEIKNA